MWSSFDGIFHPHGYGVRIGRELAAFRIAFMTGHSVAPSKPETGPLDVVTMKLFTSVRRIGVPR